MLPRHAEKEKEPRVTGLAYLVCNTIPDAGSLPSDDSQTVVSPDPDDRD